MLSKNGPRDKAMRSPADHYLFPIFTSPKACTFWQIMRSDSSRLPLAVLKASASMVSGAPSTTSGAPYSSADRLLEGQAADGFG